MASMPRACRKRSLTTIMITHNPELAARARRTVHIRDGAVHPVNDKGHLASGWPVVPR